MILTHSQRACTKAQAQSHINLLKTLIKDSDNLTINVELLSPIAMSVGLRFAIREGGRTVGAGQVTEIVG